MAVNGYLRQASANIQPGKDINAEDFNSEFNAIQSTMDNTSGHDHSGSVSGSGQKIPLTSSVTGILPLANGGLGVNASTTTVNLPVAVLVGTDGAAYSVSISGNQSSLSTARPTVNNAQIQLGSFSTTQGGGIEWEVSSTGSGTGWKLAAPNFSSGADALSLVTYFRNNSATWSEVMRVTSTGRVGIGVNNPGYGLHVNSTFGVASDATISGVLLVTGATTLQSTLQVTGATTLTGGISGATTVAGSLNATGGVSDNGNRVVSNNNKFALTSTTPADATSTSSATQTMCGFAASFTPTITGRAIITVSGAVGLGANVTGTLALRYGTGTAPVAGAAATGTLTGARVTYGGAAISAGNHGFNLSSVISGLSLSTAIWVDVEQANTDAAGTFHPVNVTISVIET